MASVVSSPHIVIFPFMSKGHIIPIIHLCRLLLRRHITVTVFTTHANSPFIRQSLDGTGVSVIDLSFPQNIPELPAGIESTDKLSSMSLFLPFVTATKLMKPEFDRALENLPNISCIISDGFLGWTQESASSLSVPRLVFYGMNNFAMCMTRVVTRDRPHAGLDSYDEPFTVPGFDWIKLTTNDFEYPFCELEPKGPLFDFVLEAGIATEKSQGMIVNSFYELETRFIDYCNQEFRPKAWCVGPLCLAEKPTEKDKAIQKPVWIQWLDEMVVKGKSVLYVAFGSQAQLTNEQLREITAGLEKSEANFLWVLRSECTEFDDGFEERVKGRGFVVKEWVNQVEILSHESVNGFLSHCGWNSVMESICESVPILAWPMMAEQHLNARLVVDDLGVGVRVLARNGSVRGFVGAECVEEMVRVLMEGEKGEEVRKKVKEYGEMAKKAMEEGVGSSWNTLDLLVEEIGGGMLVSNAKFALHPAYPL